MGPHLIQHNLSLGAQASYWVIPLSTLTLPSSLVMLLGINVQPPPSGSSLYTAALLVLIETSVHAFSLVQIIEKIW
jgi:hypothetical protein